MSYCVLIVFLLIKSASFYDFDNDYEEYQPIISYDTKFYVPIENRDIFFINSLEGNKKNNAKNKRVRRKADFTPDRNKFISTSNRFAGQLIPSGQPWPASVEEYSGFARPSETYVPPANIYFDEIKPGLDPYVPPKIPVWWGSQDQPETTTRKSPLDYVPNKPSFIGATGGSYVSQFIPPGQPWPANQEDYSTSKPATSLEDRFKETTTHRKPAEDNAPPSLEYKPSRPTFIGDTGGGFVSQFIPPGQPWPANQEDYLTSKPATSLEDRFKETTTHRKPAEDNAPPSLEYIPSRPTFIGATGGGFVSQFIPPGQPWPANHEDYTTTRPANRPLMDVEDRFKEDTTVMRPVRPHADCTTKSPLEYVPHRPSYFGGSFHVGQIIPSGTPWPDVGPVQKIPVTEPPRKPITTIKAVKTKPTTRKPSRTTSRPITTTTRKSTTQTRKPITTVRPITSTNTRPITSTRTTTTTEPVVSDNRLGEDGSDQTDCEDDEELVEENGTVVQRTTTTRPAISRRPTTTSQRTRTSTTTTTTERALSNNRIDASNTDGSQCEDDEELVEENDTGVSEGIPPRTTSERTSRPTTTSTTTTTERILANNRVDVISLNDENDCEDDEELVDEESVSESTTVIFTSGTGGTTQRIARSNNFRRNRRLRI